MSLKRKLISGGIWISGATVITAALAFLYRLLLIQNLTVYEYGLFYSIVTFFLVATTMIDMGISPAFQKFGSEFLSKRKNGKFNSLINYFLRYKIRNGILFLILVLLSSKFLSSYYFRDVAAFYLFIALGFVYFFIDIFFNFINTLLQTFQDQKLYSFYEVVKIIVQLLLLYLFILFGFGIWSPIFALFIGNAIPSFIFYFLVKAKHLEKIKTKITNVSLNYARIKKFALLNVLFAFGVYVLNYTDTIMLTALRNLEEVGLYNVAVPTAKLILFFSSAFTLILIPLTASLYSKRKFEVMNKLVNVLYKLNIVLLLPIAMILIVYPELVIRVLFTDKYLPAAKALSILSLSSVLSVFFVINTHILIGLEKAKSNLRITSIGAIFNIGLNLFLIPIYGLVGAALSTLFGYSLMSILSFRAISRKFKELTIDFKGIVYSIVSGFIFLGTLNLLKNYLEFSNIWLETITVVGISGVIYIASLFILRVVSINQINDIINLYKLKN